MKCKHVLSMESIKHRCDVVAEEHRSSTATGRGCMQWHTCAKCGSWLPLGPATDNEQTAAELRAYELAEAWKPDGGCSHIITADESRGWEGWPYRQPTNEGEFTGFLACQIRMHERDLGDVNWAGHHMADHPIDSLHAATSGEKGGQ